MMRSRLFASFVWVVVSAFFSPVFSSQAANPPADCSPVKTNTYCGCLWSCDNGPLKWSNAAGMTELGCDTKPTTCQIWNATKYYKRTPPPPQSSYCVCPIQPGETLVSSSCPNVAEGGQCGLSSCEVRTESGQLQARSCNHYLDWICRCPSIEGTGIVENDCGIPSYGSMCSENGCTLMDIEGNEFDLDCELNSILHPQAEATIPSP